MAFPGYGAQVYYNEAGEPLGWDYPSYGEPPEYDPDQDREDTWLEDLYEEALDWADAESNYGPDEEFAEWRISKTQRRLSTEEAWNNWLESKECKR